MIVADRRLYLNKDKTRIVEEGDVEAGYLFVIPGHEISDDDAKKFGLTAEPEPEPEPETWDKPAPEPEPLDVEWPEPEGAIELLEEVAVKMFEATENKMALVSENKKRKAKKRKAKD